MPRYDFYDESKEEYFDEFMTYDEKVKFLKDNPNIEPADYLNMNIIAGVSKSQLGDSGWKDTLSKIAEKHPTSPLADRYGKKTIKQLKARRVYDKHKQRTK
jgi:hypothetical protein